MAKGVKGMNEMLMALVLFQCILIAFIAGWFMANKHVERLKAQCYAYDTELVHKRDELNDERKERQLIQKQLEEFIEQQKNTVQEPMPSNPLDNVLSALIAETDKQDEAEAVRLKEIKSAWNFQPVPVSKRMKGDS